MEDLMGLIDKKWRSIYPNSKQMQQTNMNNGINLIALFNFDRLASSFNMKYKKRSEIIVTVFITILSIIYGYYCINIIIFKIHISKLGGIKFFLEASINFYIYFGLLIGTMVKGSQINTLDK